MNVVLGIGNPGREYAATRHNVGFRVVDRVAASIGVEVRKARFRGLVGEGRLGTERVLLVKPETYVNLSGECARGTLDYFGLAPEALLVVADDANLPPGRLRCRRGGSSGGHKGIESIIGHLGTEEFVRLRIGVGRPEGGGDLTSYVLGGFSREEAEDALRAEARAAEAVAEWVRNGVDACMNRFNRPEEEEWKDEV